MGFPSLAAFIASDKGKTTHIYRRFERLGARNLLYIQDELAELENRLDEFDREDARQPREEKKSLRNYSLLMDRVAEEDSDEREYQRLKLILKIRERMKEYREYTLNLLKGKLEVIHSRRGKCLFRERCFVTSVAIQAGSQGLLAQVP